MATKFNESASVEKTVKADAMNDDEKNPEATGMNEAGTDKTAVSPTKIVAGNAAPEAGASAAGDAPQRVRYSDADLQMFKENILQKLAKAKEDYAMLRQTITHGSSNGDEDTSPTFKPIEDGDISTSKEEINQLAQRQYRFIHSLEAALVRIENKTYGISRISGKLIPKERLLLVPHATLSVEDKNNR